MVPAWKFEILNSARIKIQKADPMSIFPDFPTDIDIRWKTPTFQVIPISFEASSYALIDDDDDL
jgi:hypothetical protein